ncbi:MAG: PorT family protein [Prolixibacteraceae bacterium]|nr:PorT family protein [Prolixibacteraceae bacterium]
MKRIILIILLISAIHTVAQEATGNKFYLGVSPGVNLSRVNFSLSTQQMLDLTTDQNFTLGYNGGFVFIYYSEPRLGLQMELNYSRRGWTEGPDTSLYYSRNLEYIEFPFLSRFDIGVKKIKFTITAGPVLSYLFSDSEVINIPDEALSKSYYNHAIDNKTEVGFCIGLGLSQYIGNSIIQFEIRLNHGLNELFSEGKRLDLATS